MRVPLPIVIITCLLTATVTWLLGTHRLDFTKAPTPEEMVEISANWEQARPYTTHRQKTSHPPSANEVGAQSNKPEQPAESPQPPLPGTDFEQPPSLSEFGTLSDQDLPILKQLGDHLESSGHAQHALLAWERMIDTSTPTWEQRLEAAQAIRRLKNSMPAWNPGTSKAIPVILHAGASLQPSDALEAALATTAELISRASGNILQVGSKTSIGKIRNLDTTSTPVAIWFSLPGGSNQDILAETIPVSFMVNPAKPDMFTEEVALGVYSLVRSHLKNKTDFTPLPEHGEFPGDVSPDELISLHITRLMWREFANGIGQ